MLVAGLLLGWNCSAKVYLVSVGISDYPGTANDLHLCTNDARQVDEVYRLNGNTVSSLLLDSRATGDNIVAELRRVLGQAKAADIAVFYFSGHGYPGGFRAYDRMLSYTEIRKAMSTSKSNNKMIFADACFSGKIRTDKKQSQPSKWNVMLFLSSRSNEVSIEKNGMENGIFTTWLQRGLRGGADANRDSVVTAQELYQFVAPGVAKTSMQKQHPVMWGSFPNNMPVISWKKKR